MNCIDLTPSHKRTPESFILSNDDVHIWSASLNQTEAHHRQFLQTLSRNELARMSHYTDEGKKKHFTLSHGLLRTILGRYLGIEASEVRIRYEQHGKPVLAQSYRSEALHFSLSHSFDRVIFGLVLNRRIGIDLEYVRPISGIDHITKRFFSMSEHALLQSLPKNQKVRTFFQIWTRKEAYLKAWGKGILQPMGWFDVSREPGKVTGAFNGLGKAQEFSGWSHRDIIPFGGHLAAVAVEGFNWQLSHKQL